MTFSHVHSFPSRRWESSLMFAVISYFLWANVRLLSHSAWWSSASRLNVSVWYFKNILGSPEPLFPLNAPHPTTTTNTIYHLLDVLHVVVFAPLGVITNIKNEVSNKDTYTPLCCTFLQAARHLAWFLGGSLTVISPANWQFLKGYWSAFVFLVILQFICSALMLKICVRSWPPHVLHQ